MNVNQNRKKNVCVFSVNDLFRFESENLSMKNSRIIKKNVEAIKTKQKNIKWNRGNKAAFTFEWALH